jgi:hypothetical protein
VKLVKLVQFKGGGAFLEGYKDRDFFYQVPNSFKDVAGSFESSV